MEHLLLNDSLIGQFFQVVPITLLVGVIYVFFRYRYLRRQGMAIAWGPESIRALFVCYLTGLLNLVWVPNNFWTAIWFYLFHGYSGTEIGPIFTIEFNFVPSIYAYIKGELLLGSWVKTMLSFNALMFMPMGVFLRLICKRINGRNIVPVAIAIPLVIEVLQPIVGRSFDVDDLLMNFIGITVAYFVTAFLLKIAKNK